MSGSYSPIPLEVQYPGFGPLAQYNNVLKTQAETTGIYQGQIPLQQAEAAQQNALAGKTGAETVGQQLTNQLTGINLGVRQYGLNALQGGGGPEAPPLPPGATGADNSGYTAPDANYTARYSTAQPPPSPAQALVLNQAAAKYGVPPQVANWVGYHESSWNRNAVGPQTSSGQAQGAFQFMPGTAKQYGLQDPTDFASSSDAAMHYLSDLYAKTGDWTSAIQAYGTFSTGQGAARDSAARQGFMTYAQNNGIPVPGSPGGQGGGPGGGQGGPPQAQGPGGTVQAAGPAAPPSAPPSTLAANTPPPSPNALGQTSPEAQNWAAGTSQNATVASQLGIGVPLPKFKVAQILSSPDPAKATNEALAERRATIANVVSGATDLQSWNAADLQLWRAGLITNGEYQQHLNHPEYRDAVIRQQATADAQVGAQTAAQGEGMTLTQTGPQIDPTSMTAKHPEGISQTVLGADGKYYQIKAPTASVAGNVPGARVNTAPGGGIQGPGAQQPPPQQQPSAAAAPPPGPAPTAPPPPTPAGAGPVQAAGPAAPPPPAPVAAPAAAQPQGGPVLPAGAYLEKPPGLGPVQQRQAEIDKSQIDDDRKYVADLNDQRTASLQTQQQLLNARTMAAGLPTGAWKQSVASWENILKTYAPDVLNRAVSAISQINPNDAGKFQELAKISLQMAGQAENQVAGSHGGFNLVKLYHDSFPGLETQPDAYREMMNLFLVQHQFNVDHAQAVNSYYGPAQQANKVDPLGHPYTPVSQAVDEPFLAQGSTHNPSVYVAATALLNNHPATQAMASLTDQQKVEAIQVARRADPGHVFSPNGKAAASAP